jgi:flagellar biosynthesis/type III secretory pathway protein FliH
MTGRGFGSCAASDAEDRGIGFGTGRGLGRGRRSGRGFGRGFDRGFGRGSGKGFSRGYGMYSDISKSQKELLNERKGFLQSRLEAIEKQLEDL